MSKVQIDDFYCECDFKEGMGELDIKLKEYSCLRCGSSEMRVLNG